jgi:hypothetical protein
VGTLVELGNAVHSSGFCLFILWKVFAFAFAFVLASRQAASRFRLDSAQLPIYNKFNINSLRKHVT